MEKKAFYKRNDAMSYANDLADNIGGYISDKEVINYLSREGGIYGTL